MNLGFSMSSSQCLILLIAAYKAYLSYSQATTPLVGSDVSLHWFKNKAEIRLPGELRVVNEGLTHDDEYWYMSNQHVLYKTTVDPITIVLANYRAIPDELVKLRYNHIGDIDYDRGLIYGGMETSGDDNGVIGVWNATDLTLVKYVFTTQNGFPWLAIETTSRTLYGNVWNDVSSINVYDLDSLQLRGSMRPAIDNTLPKEIQGGAVWSNDPRGLYLAVNGNCSVYRLDVHSGEVSLVLSDTYAKRPHEYEMEGITFWDLRKTDGQDLGVMHMFGNFMTLAEKSIHNFSPL